MSESLTSHLARHVRRRPGVTRQETVAQDPARLSPAECRLWLLDSLDPSGAAYVSSWVTLWHGVFDQRAAARALGHIIERHEPLRTLLAVDAEGLPRCDVQSVNALHDGDDAPFVLPLETLGSFAETDDWRAAVRTLLDRRFDLSRDFPVRAGVARLGSDAHVLAIAIHHIACDGWSMRIVEREFHQIYDAIRREQTPRLAELPTGYRECMATEIARQHGPDYEKQLDFWCEKLASPLPDIPLPSPLHGSAVDQPDSGEQSHDGEYREISGSGNEPKSSTVQLSLSQDEVHALDRFVADHTATRFMVLLAVFESVLHRYGGGEDIVLGTPLANRRSVAAENLIGLFVETLVLRIAVHSSDRFVDVLDRVKQQTLVALEHPDVPFDALVQRLQPTRLSDRNPLFQVMFVLQNTPRETHRQAEAEVTVCTDIARSVSKFAFSLQIIPTDDALYLDATYDDALYDAGFVAELLANFRVLLAAAIKSPATTVAQLPLLQPEQLTRAVVDWNRTDMPCDSKRSLARRVFEQAALTPDAVALRCAAEQWRYADVADRAVALGNTLREHGVARGSYVPLLLEHGVDVVFAELACLLCGAVFVPLDPRWPVARLAPLIEELSPPVALISERESANLENALKALSDSGLRLLPIPRGPVARLSPADREAALLPDQQADEPAYIIYTSGSSGRPKGAINRHLGILNRLDDMTRRFGITADDVVLQSSAPHFDPSIWQIFWSLTSGASTVIPAPGEMNDFAAALALIARERVSVTHLVPSWLAALLAEVGVDPARAHDYRFLREVLIGGEAISPTHVAMLVRWLPALGVSNVYGPSETAMGVLFERVRVPVESMLPIGRPIANAKALIVDSSLNPVPVGVAGELLIGGDCVGLGYLDRPVLTQRAFISNRWPAVRSERWYRTGDRARYRADGRIDFLGRLDDQLQLRGMRVEPGDIERALVRLAAVADALVKAVVPPGAAEAVLVAFVVPTHATRCTAAELHVAARASLPTHMCPAHYVFLQALPRLSNGKIDRHALPEPEWRESTTASRPTSDVPISATQTMVLALWQELVPHVRVERDTSYFDQGGHSLLLAQFAARIAARTGIRVSLRVLFDEPTPAATANYLENNRRGAGPPRARASDVSMQSGEPVWRPECVETGEI